MCPRTISYGLSMILYIYILLITSSLWPIRVGGTWIRNRKSEAIRRWSLKRTFIFHGIRAELLCRVNIRRVGTVEKKHNYPSWNTGLKTENPLFLVSTIVSNVRFTVTFCLIQCGSRPFHYSDQTWFFEDTHGFPIKNKY